MKRIALITLIFALSIPACSETHETPDLSGETHWLKACANSDACGKLECTCGYCVAECASNGACNVEGRDTFCNLVGSDVVNAICAGFEDEKDLCLEECTNGDDCNKGEACLEGSCVLFCRTDFTFRGRSVSYIQAICTPKIETEFSEFNKGESL